MKISNIFLLEEKKTWDLIHKTSHIRKTALAALSWDAVYFTGTVAQKYNEFFKVYSGQVEYNQKENKSLIWLKDKILA
jgi:hypothetical protein